MGKSSIDVAIENELSRSPLNELFCEDSVIAPSVSLGFAGVGIDTLTTELWPARRLQLANTISMIRGKYMFWYPVGASGLSNLRNIYRLVDREIDIVRMREMGQWPS